MPKHSPQPLLDLDALSVELDHTPKSVQVAADYWSRVIETRNMYLSLIKQGINRRQAVLQVCDTLTIGKPVTVYERLHAYLEEVKRQEAV